MLKRIILFLTLMGISALSMFYIPAPFFLISAIIFLFALGALINGTDLLYRKRNFREEENPELMDPRAAAVAVRKGHRKAVLLIHGFSSCPWLFHKHIPLFEEAGYDVLAPRLPGHGTSPEAFLKSGFSDYYRCAEETLKQYRPQYEELHLIGISMGGLLALKLAEEYSSGAYAPTTLTTLAAPMRLADPRIALIRTLGWLKPKMKGEWDPQRESDGGESWIGYHDLFLPQAYSVAMAMLRIRDGLARINLPHLLIHAKGDKDAPFDSIYRIAANTSSAAQELWVPDLSERDHSRHSLFLYDSLRDSLFRRIRGFIEEHGALD